MSFDAISQANVPFWGTLPMGITNFGGDIQVSTVPDCGSGQIGCMLNAQGLAAINNQGQQSIYNNWGFTPSTDNPFMDNMEKNAEQISKALALQTINTQLNVIAMAKQRLNAMLMDSKYSKHKEEIKKLLDRLTAEETKLNDLAAETDLTPSEMYKKAAAIEKNIRVIIEDMSKIGKSNSSSETEETEETEETDNDDDNDDIEEGNDEDNDGIRDHATYSDEAFVLADQFYQATYGGFGTDNDAFNAVCDQITENNVVDIMLAWKDTHSAEKGESFMTAFMWDANRSQKIKYGRIIKQALMIEARKLGVMDKCKDDFAAIDKEMNSWIYVNNDVAKNYDNIIKVLAEAKRQPYNTNDFKY